MDGAVLYSYYCSILFHIDGCIVQVRSVLGTGFVPGALYYTCYTCVSIVKSLLKVIVKY